MVAVERRVKSGLLLWRSIEIAVLLIANTSVGEPTIVVVFHKVVTRSLKMIGVIWHTATNRAFLVVTLENVTT